MATIYEVEIVSHWINYPKEELQKRLEEANKTIEENGNEIDVKVKTRS
jgi:predicted kinase